MSVTRMTGPIEDGSKVLFSRTLFSLMISVRFIGSPREQSDEAMIISPLYDFESRLGESGLCEAGDDGAAMNCPGEAPKVGELST